eukprot:14120962-Heterocapsa_arctica.AAC.1
MAVATAVAIAAAIVAAITTAAGATLTAVVKALSDNSRWQACRISQPLHLLSQMLMWVYMGAYLFEAGRLRESERASKPYLCS